MVEDLQYLAPQDFKDLGFSMGLKCKVLKYLAERKKRMGGD